MEHNHVEINYIKCNHVGSEINNILTILTKNITLITASLRSAVMSLIFTSISCAFDWRDFPSLQDSAGQLSRKQLLPAPKSIVFSPPSCLR